jgi:hypothetical protein
MHGYFTIFVYFYYKNIKIVSKKDIFALDFNVYSQKLPIFQNKASHQGIQAYKIKKGIIVSSH